MARTVGMMLVLSLPGAALWSLPTPSRRGVAARCGGVSMADTAEAGTAILSEWDSKKPIHVETWVPKAEDMDNRNKQWWLIDAEGMRLGRMCTEIAKRLMGKHKVRTYAARSQLAGRARHTAGADAEAAARAPSHCQCNRWSLTPRLPRAPTPPHSRVRARR